MIAPGRDVPEGADVKPAPSIGGMGSPAPTRRRSRVASPRRLSAAERRVLADAAALPDHAKLIDLEVVAAASGASITTVRYWVKSGRLRATRVDRRVRVTVADWLDFLERSRTS